MVKGNVVGVAGSPTQIPSTSWCTQWLRLRTLPHPEMPGRSPSPPLQVACNQPINDCDGTPKSSPFASSWYDLVVQFPLLLGSG